MLISDNLRLAICEQIAHEQYNSNLYMFIGAFLKNKGLDGLAKHFENQRVEEFEHAKHFLDLLTDLNSEVIVPEIGEVNFQNVPLTSIVDIGNAYLAREELTTRSINDLKKLAISEDNPVVEEKMREMISKQQGEYEEATTFLDNAMLCGDDWWKAKVWSDSVK